MGGVKGEGLSLTHEQEGERNVIAAGRVDGAHYCSNERADEPEQRYHHDVPFDRDVGAGETGFGFQRGAAWGGDLLLEGGGRAARLGGGRRCRQWLLLLLLLLEERKLLLEVEWLEVVRRLTRQQAHHVLLLELELVLACRLRDWKLSGVCGASLANASRGAAAGRRLIGALGGLVVR